MTADLLDRPVWNMLTGPQAHLAARPGKGAALRIDRGYGPFAAASGQGAEAQAALAGLLQDHQDAIWLVEREAVPAPPGTRLIRTADLVQMVARVPMPVQPGDEVPRLLGEGDAAEMSALALATEPGPWGNLTRLYGQFFGLHRDGRLAAMAGERMQPSPIFAEVSGVCTWPDFRGQGLAAQLIRRVMAGITRRGQVPFLHSYADNAKAIGLYESLGFVIRRTMVVTVLAKA